MANVELSDLFTEVRVITARLSPNQLTDSAITQAINLVYEFDLPNELKTFDFKTTYEFITQPNVDQYHLSQDDRNDYKSFEPPVYCSGYDISYYQNYETFFRLWPRLNTEAELTTGTGILGPYTGTLAATPILRESLLVSAENGAGVTLTARDDGAGALTGDVSAGTVDYITGAISVTWTSAITSGNSITAKWNAYAAARPQGLLYYDNTFTVRNVPDKAYTIEIQAYLKPTAYISTTTSARPFLDEYFQFLAYAAARKIFIRSKQRENVQSIQPYYDEQMRFIERRTIMQIKNQKTPTIYNSEVGSPSNEYNNYY